MLKDISKIFGANIIKMLVALVTTFLVPKVLSVDGFGQFKMFTFYVTYVGLTQLGFCDGIYLKYGGFRKQDIRQEMIRNEHSTFVIYEIISSLIVTSIGLALNSFEITMLGLIILPLQMYSFYSFVYQATGQLSEYSRILSISNIGKLIILLFLIVLRIDNYKAYIVATIIGDYFLFLLYFVPFLKENSPIFTGFHIDVFFETCKLGILLMVGNLMYALFLGVDKWFIKFTLPLSDFSYYSFAGQLITAVNMVVTPISMTLYSYISRAKNQDFEKGLMERLITFLMLIPIGSYIAELVIYGFLNKYTASIQVLEILMISQIFWALNTSIFVNMFKAYKLQKVYFIKMLISLCIAVALDTVVYFVHPSIVLYSVVTMMTSIAWIFINSLSFKHLRMAMVDYVYVVSLLLVAGLTWKSSLVVKFVSYIIAYALLTIALKRTVITFVILYLKNIRVKKK